MVCAYLLHSGLFTSSDQVTTLLLFDQVTILLRLIRLRSSTSFDQVMIFLLVRLRSSLFYQVTILLLFDQVTILLVFMIRSRPSFFL